MHVAGITAVILYSVIAQKPRHHKKHKKHREHSEGDRPKKKHKHRSRRKE